MRTRGHHLAESRSCQTRRARRSHARKTARRTCCWFAPGWRYSVRSCKIWSMPACCGCHMGGGGGAAMVSPRPRPSRVSFDRSSRDGDGQTIGSRLVNGGTVRRRAPLAVTPGRLNRSPIRVSKTRRLARGTRQWRLGAAVTVPARRLRRMSAAKRLFSGRPEKGPAVHVRALVRSCPTAHAPRVPSRDARTMRRPRRSPSAYPRTCCGSSRCVSRSSAAGVRRLPAIPKRAFLFRGRRQRVVVTHARIASVRPRGVPSRIARTSSHSQTLFSPPRFRAPFQHARSRETASRHPTRRWMMLLIR